MADNKVIAETILAQIGGAQRLKAMWGRHIALMSYSDKPILQIGNIKNANGGITAIQVELMPSDTYQVRTYKPWKPTSKQYISMTEEELMARSKASCDPRETRDNVYFDQLSAVLEELTGMYLSI